MKKRLLFTVMAALCLNFSNMASAQTPINQAVDVTTKGIQIGQKIPDNLPALVEFKGKLIILDFWATWCSPCVAMIPKMEALQKEFKDQIQIIQVTYQSDEIVNKFLETLYNGEPSVLTKINKDKVFHVFFPHLTLPHYIWIDRHGIIRAITGLEEVSAQNIKKMLVSPKDFLLKQKADKKISYDKNKPLLIDNNGGMGKNLLAHSVLTSFTEGLSGGYSRKPPEGEYGERITVWNQSLRNLFALAYSNGTTYYAPNRIKIVSDTNDVYNFSPDNRKEWVRNNTFCYELVVPKSLIGKEYAIMQQDMERYFPKYQVKVAKAMAKCLVLVRTSKMDKIKSTNTQTKMDFSPKGCTMRNCYLNDLISRLEVMFLQNSPYPIINGTDYQHRVDMDINASLSDVGAMNRELKKYDLKLVEADRNIDMLVIKSNR